jgi:hypothetical protein
LQVVYEHVELDGTEPAMQLMPVAFKTVVLQLIEQLPHCVSVFANWQPVLPVPLRHASGSQTKTHDDAPHAGVAFVVLHAIPQPPQLRASDEISMQSPAPASPPQQLWLLGQLSAPPSASAEHVATQFPDGLHTEPGSPTAAPQSALVRQFTHSCATQNFAAPPAHSASLSLHPAAQLFVAVQ